MRSVLLYICRVGIRTRSDPRCCILLVLFLCLLGFQAYASAGGYGQFMLCLWKVRCGAVVEGCGVEWAWSVEFCDTTLWFWGWLLGFEGMKRKGGGKRGVWVEMRVKGSRAVSLIFNLRRTKTSIATEIQEASITNTYATPRIHWYSTSLCLPRSCYQIPFQYQGTYIEAKYFQSPSTWLSVRTSQIRSQKP